MATLIDGVFVLFIAYLFAVLLGAIFLKEKGKKFLAMKPVQLKCVIMALAFTAVTILALLKGGDTAIVGASICGPVAFGLVFGAALYDG